MTDLPDYVVIRPAPGLPEGFLPPAWDGRWLDRSKMHAASRSWVGAPTAVAEPAGRFETRDDGAVAEVWEVRPNE